MSIYLDLLGRIAQAYQDAGNGFHTSEANRKIADALAGFEPPLDNFCKACAHMSGAWDDGEACTIRDSLRALDTQCLVLEAATASAARSDDVKIKRNRVDQISQLAQARVQQEADTMLVREVAKLIETVHGDARRLGAPSGEESGHQDRGARAHAPAPLPIDPAALQRSLERRAAPKEDALRRRQLGQIGGQASQNVEASR